VPGGLAGDVWGPRAVLSLSILLWSITLAALAWMPGVAGFTGVRLAFGLTQAPAYPNLSKVTRSWFPLSVRTTVQGMVASLSGRAGGACAPLLVATFLMAGLGLGWRGVMVVIAAAGLLLALAFWLLFRNSPAEHPWTNEAEQSLIDDKPVAPLSPSKAGLDELPPSRAEDAIQTTRPANPAPPVRPTPDRPRFDFSGANLATLTALLLYAFASTFVDQLFVNWVPQFLVESKGMSQASMGFFASLPLWGGAIGGAVGGMLNDAMIRWTGSRRWSRGSVAFTGKLLSAILLTLAVQMADGAAVALMLFACKFFGDWSNATVWGAITDVGGRAAGTVFGVINMAGAIAGFAANPLIGHLKQDHGWELTFDVLAAVFLLAGVMWLFINSDRRLLREE
jgi:nitrate/nitrite transporter NarK